jgi:NAD(P)-dependent dehydrogenase (short-subunit alcohol dehydrogenase family)
MPKTIVITGTATGMGRATVGKFAAEVWNVVAAVRKEPDLKAHPGLRCVKTVLLDVDDEAAAVPFARLAREQFGGVDALVNNACYYQMGPLEGTSMEQVHRQYQTNVFSIAAARPGIPPAPLAPPPEQRPGTGRHEEGNRNEDHGRWPGCGG